MTKRHYICAGSKSVDVDMPGRREVIFLETLLSFSKGKHGIKKYRMTLH